MPSTAVGLILFRISSLHWLDFKLVSGETNDLCKDRFAAPKTDFSLREETSKKKKKKHRRDVQRCTFAREIYIRRKQTTANGRYFARYVVNLEANAYIVRGSTNDGISIKSADDARLRDEDKGRMLVSEVIEIVSTVARCLLPSVQCFWTRIERYETPINLTCNAARL